MVVKTLLIGKQITFTDNVFNIVFHFGPSIVFFFSCTNIKLAIQLKYLVANQDYIFAMYGTFFLSFLMS